MAKKNKRKKYTIEVDDAGRLHIKDRDLAWRVLFQLATDERFVIETSLIDPELPEKVMARCPRPLDWTCPVVISDARLVVRNRKPWGKGLRGEV